ncbi:hypothetical protein C8Q75DRAFT_737811 [Abortiporus biennis]|nr:hypothetical protein C8Q75DRAFT_737811 [Abortiporus biennis]
MSVVEINRFTILDASIADPKNILSICKDTKQADGCQKIYYGIQYEESVMHLIVVWESVDHYKAFIGDNSKTVHLPIMSGLAEFGKSTHEILHVDFTLDPVPLLQAPITEFTYITLKPNVAVQDFAELMDLVVEKSKGFIEGLGTSWGRTLEHENLFVLLMGWYSYADHMKNIAENEDQKVLTPRLLELGDFTLTHVELTEFHEI